MNKEIYEISKRSLAIRPLSNGCSVTWVCALMRHNDPSSTKRHMHPLKADICSDAVIIIVFLLSVVASIVCGSFLCLVRILLGSTLCFFSSFSIMPLCKIDFFLSSGYYIAVIVLCPFPTVPLVGQYCMILAIVGHSRLFFME